MSKVEVIALMYPSIPLTLLVLLTIILFVTAVTIQVTEETLYLPFILASILVGALDGSLFTSFLFLGITNTDLPCDMNLHFRERSLVVNLLLSSQRLGRFVGFVAAYFYFLYTDPALVSYLRG